jgi:uncharacterized protein YciI
VLFKNIMAKKKKILFFINGPHPTAEQLEQGKSVGAAFRNTRFIQEGESLEQAEAFAGEVPEVYKKAFPNVEVIDFAKPAPETPAAPEAPVVEEAAEAAPEAAPVAVKPAKGKGKK